MLREGEEVGPYVVAGVIGRGGFGVVLLAHDSRFKDLNDVALKIVPCDHLEETAAAKARDQAFAEANLLRRLRHPHIVTCYEMCWDSERRMVWLALDYMDGGELQHLICNRTNAGEQPPEAAFVRLVLVAVASALDYIHGEDVLHRDVKPSNILLSKDMSHVKLADFGISKVLEATGHAHTFIGTPFYLSPEVVNGMPYGAPSDAWALGVSIYELAVLRKPFEAANQLALARIIMERPFPDLPSTTSKDIAQAVGGLLEKDPNLRLSLSDVFRLQGRGDLVFAAALNAHTHFSLPVPSESEEQLCDVLSPRESQNTTELLGLSIDDQPVEEKSTARLLPKTSISTRGKARKGKPWFSFRWPSWARGNCLASSENVQDGPALFYPEDADTSRGIMQHQPAAIPSTQSESKSPEKVAVVIGGVTDICLEIVRACRNQGFKVVLTLDDEARGQDAAHELSCEFQPLYLESRASILDCAREVEQRHGVVDVLINCHMLSFRYKNPTPWTQKVCITICANFFCAATVCDCFVPLLREGGRLIHIVADSGHLSILRSEQLRQEFASADHTLTMERLSQLMAQFVSDVQASTSDSSSPSEDWPHIAKGWPNHALGMSLLGRIALTKVQARCLAPRRISVTCCDPWGIGANGSYSRTCAQCADTPVWLATEGNLKSSGQFFKDRTAVAW